MAIEIEIFDGFQLTWTVAVEYPNETKANLNIYLHAL